MRQLVCVRLVCIFDESHHFKCGVRAERELIIPRHRLYKYKYITHMCIEMITTFLLRISI